MKKIALTILLVALFLSTGYCQEQPLQLTIKSDKEIYAVEDTISIKFNFKNISTKPIALSYWGTDDPYDFELSKINGQHIVTQKPKRAYLAIATTRVKLLPGEEFNYSVSPNEWFGSTKLTGKILVKGIFRSQGSGKFDGAEIFEGKLTSNIITIEIVEKQPAPVLKVK